MDYAQQQRSPIKHLTGIGAVLLLHVLVGYALVNGLARKVVEVIRSPMETKIIEEASKPPDDIPPPPPKLLQLPPAFVPPPEVQVQAPAAPRPTISNTTSVVAPVRSVPAAVLAPPNVGVACPNSQRVRSEIAYPARAKREELEGNVLIEFTVTVDGSIKDIDVRSSSDPIFNTVSVNAVRQFKCNTQDRDVRVTVPFVFKLVN